MQHFVEPKLRCGATRRRISIILGLSLILCAWSVKGVTRLPEVPQLIRSKAPDTCQPLGLGEPVERGLAGGQKHSYQINLTAGQYASVIVLQRGIDVVIRLRGPNDDLNLEVDSEVAANGQEKVEVVAETSGAYNLIVDTRYKGASAGRYEIRLAELRAATENDRLLHQARKLSAESMQLRQDAKYDEAISKAEQALRIRQQVLGPDHLDIADSLNDLATIYRGARGEFKAEEFLRRSLNIREKILGPDNPTTAATLYDIAELRIRRGEYEDAKQLLERILPIFEEKLGDSHFGVADVLRRLAQIHKHNNDYSTAESLLQRALEIDRRAFGYENAVTQNMLEVLASAYRERGEYGKAATLYLQALSEIETEFGAYSVDLIYLLNSLAATYRGSSDYVRAESACQRALQIIEKANMMDKAIAAITNFRLARIYELRGDPVSAGPLFERAMNIWQNLLGAEHPEVLANLSPLIRNYAAAGKIEDAIKFQSRENEITERMIARSVLFESERQKLNYLLTRGQQADRSISLHIQLAPDSVRARDLAITSILQRKGRVQDVMADSLWALHRRFSPAGGLLLDQLNETASRLAKLVLSGPQKVTPSEHQKQISILEEQRENLEVEIGRRSNGFYQESRPVALSDIKSAIPDNAALIEYVLYKPFRPNIDGGDYGEPRYAVYVVRNREEVRWQELGDAKSIDAAVDRFRRALRDPNRRDVKPLARTVDELIMHPIRQLLGDAKQLLISADATLNLIPFEALVDEHHRYLVESFSCTYLTSGRDLLRMQVSRDSKMPPVIMANPRFGEPELIASTKRARPKPHAVSFDRKPESRTKGQSLTSGSDISSVYFAPLDGTAGEAESIKSLFAQANIKIGAEATESSLKQVAAPKILHIATHGFFLTDTPVSPPSVKGESTRAISANAKIENPLLRSGLAFAGANLRKNNGDDGILTALEASGLNLWGTKLVTLSGCDTGIGDVKNGEGVYGLRRAFVLAGAETVVMSLWPISDYATREMMSAYYKGLKEGLGRGEALRQVQLSLLKRNNRQHPFYWAAFIQSGEWANLDGKR